MDGDNLKGGLVVFFGFFFRSPLWNLMVMDPDRTNCVVNVSAPGVQFKANTERTVKRRLECTWSVCQIQPGITTHTHKHRSTKHTVYRTLAFVWSLRHLTLPHPALLLASLLSLT